MTLCGNDLFLLSQCAISAAYQAGHLISTYRDRPIHIHPKKNGENLASQVVTEVDHLSQAIILSTLLPTCEIFDLAILSEETPDNHGRLLKDYFWCIDPLDGTLPFIESTPGYSVSIALVSRTGTPHIGVIYDPVEQTLYHALKGSGAFRNGKPLIPGTVQPSAVQKLTFISDRSFQQHPLFTTIVAELQVIATDMNCAGVAMRTRGGAAMNACWTLEKNPSCYFKFPKPQQGGGSLWDYAATACIFQEAGAVACDISGNPLDLNRPDSTFMNHRGVLFSSDPFLAERIMGLYTRLQKEG